MHQFYLREIAQWMGIRCTKDAEACGVSVDSRLHQAQNLFFALPGAKADGHQYLKEVASKGAAGAVVKNDYQGPDYGLTLLPVADPLEALQQFAKGVLAQSKARIVAITGSLGKTSTKDFMTTVLQEKFRVASSPGNSNSQIGLPLAILNHTDGNEDIVVLEMGMTHRGQITKLVQLAPPECAVITTVSLVHACNFHSLEEIALAKSEILGHPKTKVGILNRDMTNYEEISKMGTCQKISFSYDNPLADYTFHSSDTVRYQGRRHHLGTFPLRGKHQQTNFLSVVACARYFGMDWSEISRGMQKLVLPAYRGQTFEKEGILFINDAYNAAELSIKAALENLPSAPAGGRKVAVLADMLELGKFSEQAHRAVGEYALDFVDLMFCYGNESRYILESWQKASRPVQWFSQREDLIRSLRRQLRKGDVVLIKGSRGMQLSKLLDEWETISI